MPERSERTMLGCEKKFSVLLLVASVTAVLFCRGEAGRFSAQEKDDAFFVPVEQLGRHTRMHLSTTRLLNLGPTGMLGFPYRNESLVVSFIEKGSPADGVMQVGDVIVEANGRTLDEAFLILIDDMPQSRLSKDYYFRKTFSFC